MELTGSGAEKKQAGRSDWLRFYLPAAGALLLFLLLTNARAPLLEAVDLVDANDVRSYLVVSSAAPLFPTEAIPFHLAQRFLPHFVVGYASLVSGASREAVYFGLNLTLLAAVFICFALLLAGRGRARGTTLLALALAALSPYAFRLNILVPGMLADLVYILGLALCLSAVYAGRAWLLLAGGVLAVAGKQMILLSLPGLLLLAYFELGERRGKAYAAAACALLAAAVFGMNGLLARLSSGFAMESTINARLMFSFFPWLASPSFTLYGLAEHLLRTFLPAAPFAILAVAGLVKGGRRAWTKENWALLLLSLGPMAYAFFPGPAVQMQNQSRYTASAALPMALLALNLLPAGWRLGRKDLLALAPILAAYSYHHRYCLAPSSPKVFLAVHLAGLASFLVWVVLRLRPSVRGEQLPDQRNY